MKDRNMTTDYRNRMSILNAYKRRLTMASHYICCLIWILPLLAGISFPNSAEAQFKSIYQIQYSTATDGSSPLNGQIIDCSGGVVVYKMVRSVPRLLLYDPDYPDGWGSIQVKDRYNITDYFEGIEVGDGVELQHVQVEDFRGTTFLQLDQANNPIITVISSDNPLPSALLLDPNQIAAPLPDGSGDYFVADHFAEKYESLLVRVENVMVTQMGLGKAQDNYELTSISNQNRCWAADFYNEDRDTFNPYFDNVQLGQKFCFVEGMLEQYTKISDGFDYYQIMTLCADHLKLPSTADLNDDCRVDMIDFDIFSSYWLTTDCGSSQCCERADCNHDNTLDLTDLACFVNGWLDGVGD